ncbi:MAG: hypothetical protein AMXMBFR83_08020 [Phycisphaerae bacterium]
MRCTLWTSAGLLALASTAAGQVVRGQWDFDNLDLSPTVGVALGYYNPSNNGATAAKTQFGTTAGFGIAHVGGQVATVMKFPACLSNEGYILHTNAPPNGGGVYVNQYTLIMDLYFPSSAAGWRALFQTNLNNANDADCFVHNTSNGVGISGQYHGSLAFNTWNRLAVTVDCGARVMNKYINGTYVGTSTLESGLDGRWSLYGANDPQDHVLLFTDDNGDTRGGYVNSIQFRDGVMSAGEIAALGGPSAAGIPLPTPPGSLTLTSPNGGESWPAGTSRLITWSSTSPSGMVNIDLYQGTALHGQIGTAAMSDGQFAWNIPASIGDAANYRVRVSAAAFPHVFDESNGPFTIYGSVEPTPIITKLPLLQGPYPDRMTLIWETDQAGGTQAVQWGRADVTENTTTEVINTRIDAAHHVHEATFGPLEAETVYLYRVRSGNTWSDVYSFRSAPRRATPTRVVWFGDEHNYTIFRRQVPRIAAEYPDLVIAAGDIMNNGNVISEWHDYWFKPLEVAYLGQTVPVLLARGNHDGEFPLAYQYTALPGNEAWYAFTFGNVRYIITDSNLVTAARPEQLAWLQAELASPQARSAQFRIVSFHKPPYTDIWDSVGPNGEAWIRLDWVPLFEQYGVDMVVCGHVHAYLRGQYNGVTYTIVGGAGNVLDTVQSYNWGFFVKTASVYHYAVMDVNRNKLGWVAWNIDGSQLDMFEMTSLTPLPAADFDADNDVDADDLAMFAACAAGADVPRGPDCALMDLDGDGDVDQRDYAAFQRCYGGADRPPPSGCAP